MAPVLASVAHMQDMNKHREMEPVLQENQIAEWT
jgi:hypothetical protein